MTEEGQLDNIDIGSQPTTQVITQFSNNGASTATKNDANVDILSSALSSSVSIEQQLIQRSSDNVLLAGTTAPSATAPTADDLPTPTAQCNVNETPELFQNETPDKGVAVVEKSKGTARRKSGKKRSKKTLVASRRSDRTTKSTHNLCEDGPSNDPEGPLNLEVISDYCETIIRTSKRRDMTLKEKREILMAFDKLGNPNMPQRKAAQRLGVSQPLLCKLLKHRQMYETMGADDKTSLRKRTRNGKRKDLEEALYEWYCTSKEKNMTLNRRLISEKAVSIAQELKMDNFNPSIGWLTRWKIRNSIPLCPKSGGQSNQTPRNTSTTNRVAPDHSAARWWKENIMPHLMREVKPEDFFVAQEVALFFRELPEHMKNKVPAAKQLPDRVTVLLTTNMSGTEKLPPLVVGCEYNPPVFRHVRQLPIIYTANPPTSLMTIKVFNDNYLSLWDRELSWKSRNVLLVLQDCPAHRSGPSLNHIQLCFLPLNTKQVLHPIEQGISFLFKAQYRGAFLRHINHTVDSGLAHTFPEAAAKLSSLDVLHLVAEAWENISTESITAAFRKAGFVRAATEGATVVEPVSDDQFGLNLDVICQQLVLPPLNVQEFKNWCNVDKNAKTTGDAETASTPGKTVNPETSVCSELSEVGARDAIASLRFLRRFLEEYGNGVPDYKVFYRMQSIVARAIEESRTVPTAQQITVLGTVVPVATAAGENDVTTQQQQPLSLESQSGGAVVAQQLAIAHYQQQQHQQQSQHHTQQQQTEQQQAIHFIPHSELHHGSNHIAVLSPNMVIAPPGALNLHNVLVLHLEKHYPSGLHGVQAGGGGHAPATAAWWTSATTNPGVAAFHNGHPATIVTQQQVNAAHMVTQARVIHTGSATGNILGTGNPTVATSMAGPFNVDFSSVALNANK